MTNAEKFKEVFGFKPEYNCVMPSKICNELECHCSRSCQFYYWWDKEYIPCFEMLEELQ